MEIRLAECAGFCFGVKRAIDTVYEQLAKGKTIYTYGPIVHNEEVVRELAERGVGVLENREALEKLPAQEDGSESAAVIIRAHGVPAEIYRLLEEKGLECIDATCPFVKRIHRIVEKESREGSHIVIIGNPGHPEVEGIVGWCSGSATVLEEPEEAMNFIPPEGRKLCVVSQTTFNYNKFQYIVEIFEKKGYNDSVVNTICNATEERQTQAMALAREADVSVVNTICNATEERQQSARALAREADVMIVIGGKRSSNSKKLYEICCEECADTYFIQTLDDLHLELPKSVRLVGITAGASTPNKLIEEVQNYVRINF